MSITALATLKDHLRVDGDDEDTLIQAYLDAAEAAVANRVQRVLIGAKAEPAEGSNELPLSFDVQAAVLLFAAHLYENRTAVVEGTVTELPLAVDYLLAPHRHWAPETSDAGG